MAKSYPELLNNKESRTRIFAKAATQTGDGGILDMIPEYRPAGGQSLDSEKGWTNVGRAPRKEERDDRRTSTEMLLRGRAILKDGRRVQWKPYL